MSGVHWITEPDQYLEPKLSKSGFGARTPVTVIDMFKKAVERGGNDKAMALKRPVNVRFKFLI